MKNVLFCFRIAILFISRDVALPHHFISFANDIVYFYSNHQSFPGISTCSKVSFPHWFKCVLPLLVCDPLSFYGPLMTSLHPSVHKTLSFPASPSPYNIWIVPFLTSPCAAVWLALLGLFMIYLGLIIPVFFYFISTFEFICPFWFLS